MYNDENIFTYNTEKFWIRKLNNKDIGKIAIARKMQEIENGNGATKTYIIEYKKVLQKLFEENNIISAGAFYKEELVSLAFYNLIRFGNEKKIPYLCGVWTNPNYRERSLAIQVYKKLMEGAFERKSELQENSMLTIEGNEAAQNLYTKLGYTSIKNEMVFLGDVKKPNTNFEIIIKNKNNNYIIQTYKINGIEKLQIDYSIEQFFPHPSNIKGIMNRIIKIIILDKEMKKEEFKVCLQEFFSTHRFCKFNIKELCESEDLGKLFNIDRYSYDRLTYALENIKFEEKNGKKISIKKSNNIMNRNIVQDFKYLDRCVYEY